MSAATPFLLFPQRWTWFAFGAIAVLWLCRRVELGRWTTPTGLETPIVLLLVMTVVGNLVSTDPDLSRAKLWGIILGAALFYGVANGLRDHRSIEGMGLALVATTALVAVAGLLGTDWSSVRMVSFQSVYDRLPSLLHGLPGSGLPRTSDLFHPREVGAAVAMLLPVPAALLLFGGGRAIQWFSAVAIVLGTIMLILSQSLQAMMGLGLALLLLAVWRSRWFLLSLPLAMAALLAGVLAYGPQRIGLLLLSQDNPIGIALVLRMDIWARAVAMVHDMPFTGIGLNCFPLVLTEFYPGYALGPEVHAHNLFLQTAVDLGLPGLGAFLWVLGRSYVGVVRSLRADGSRRRRALLLGIAAAVLAYLGNGLVDTVTLGAKPSAALWAMIGLAAASSATAAGDTVRNSLGHAWRGRRWTPILAGSALLLLGFAPGPVAPYLNVGVIRAHQILATQGGAAILPVGDVEDAAEPLRRALEMNSGSVHAWELLARLHGSRADAPAALREWERVVGLEVRDPMADHAPFEALRRRLTGERQGDPLGDALMIYSQWMIRYPDRAENYVRAALIWEQHRRDPARAATVIRSGIRNGAQPRDLLSYYLERLEASG